ncbi:VOC family protein [Actinomycetospora endophytica]|uniref:VOC family protein n=1 Tax=Actinomycetospora endophytica TaxID=2291215 RepID=A0ABS8PAX2_9PSEU|nr:VOC family protein [Actinomycetospora endophytica]MCD2195407.1 VOC family protein [Actinomycetospora endophytica]
MLLDGVNHIATLSHDAARLGAFYRDVFEAEIGETVPHGMHGEETMTVFRIGPHTELNVFTVPSSDGADRQTPMWHRGRLDHFGLHAASAEAFSTIRERLVAHGASDGTVNDFGGAYSMFFRDPDGLEGEVLLPKDATPAPPV